MQEDPMGMGIIDPDWFQHLLDVYGQSLAAVEDNDVVTPRIIAVAFSARDMVDQLRGRQLPERCHVVACQMNSARYFGCHRKSKGPLGWDRGVLVDGGLFPHVLRGDHMTNRKCSSLVSNISGYYCPVDAKVERDGSPYCGVHDPVAKEARRRKQIDTLAEKRIPEEGIRRSRRKG